MDFSMLKVAHSRLDTARNATVEAFCHLEFAARLVREAGNGELAEKLSKLGADALALDFTIPRSKG
jgi:hypothetical protein